MHVTHRPATRVGLSMALVSAFTFGSSGAMAKPLIEGGWSSGAAVLVRIGGAALILTIVTLLTRRGRLRISRSSLRTVVIYGVVAMAGVQLAFFNAVRTLDVGVALLLEFTAPVLLVVWTAARTRTRPSRRVVAGAVSTMLGLVLVLDLTGAGTVDPVGVAWGLLAAVGVAVFFVMSEKKADDLPPLVMAAGGTVVGTVVLLAAGLLGLVPLRVSSDVVVLGGTVVEWWVPALWLVVVSTSMAYLLGIGAVRRIGTRLASFVGLTEVLFAVLIAWLLLGEMPGPLQILGGVCIVGGIILVRTAAASPPQVPPAAALEPGLNA